MEELNWSAFKRLSVDKIRERQSFRVTSDGVFLFSATVFLDKDVEEDINVIKIIDWPRDHWNSTREDDPAVNIVPDGEGTPMGVLIDNYLNGSVADPKEAREYLLTQGVPESALGSG